MRPYQSKDVTDIERLLQQAAEDIEELTPQEIDAMARRATASSTSHQLPRRRRRAVVTVSGLILSMFLVAAWGGPVLGAMRDLLDEVAERTGLRENPPASAPPDYQPAPIPYVSVVALMNYIGSDEPVVPQTAITMRNGEQVVFVLTPPVVLYDDDQPQPEWNVAARPVTLGREIGRAVVISDGLIPCEPVVVSPPPELEHGDTILTYHAVTGGENLTLDYQVLFEGAERVRPSLTGGIARLEDGLAELSIVYHGTAPEGSTLLYVSPSGTRLEVPFVPSTGVEGPEPIVLIRVPTDSLRYGEPVGHVSVFGPDGSLIAQNRLEFACLPELRP